MLNLYEFQCTSCDVVMQIQLSKAIAGSLECLCGSPMEMCFKTEIDESVFPSGGDQVVVQS